MSSELTELWHGVKTSHSKTYGEIQRSIGQLVKK